MYVALLCNVPPGGLHGYWEQGNLLRQIKMKLTPQFVGPFKVLKCVGPKLIASCVSCLPTKEGNWVQQSGGPNSPNFPENTV